jgi:hypothetical protein
MFTLRGISLIVFASLVPLAPDLSWYTYREVKKVFEKREV